MALVLRHEPSVANLTLDKDGWTPVTDLIKGLKNNGHDVTRSDINSIVENDSKGRYSFSDNGQKIRANQGHSTKNVKLTFEQLIPPDILYHGTISAKLSSIFNEGLQKMNRHHIHLSVDIETAKTVGGRRGKPIILQIDTKTMNDDGFKFYKSENGVWLTDHIDPKYIRII